MTVDILKNRSNLLSQDGICYYIPNFFSDKESLMLYDYVVNGDIQWRSDKIKMFGRTYEQPRKVAFYGDPGVQYAYSKIAMQALPWGEYLKDINQKVADTTGFNANTVLVNYYRTGKDHMSWHTDSESELGVNPTIVSLSVGAERRFILRHKSTGEKIELRLESGSLLVMQGSSQHHWQHCLPKMPRVSEDRVNLTFRNSSAKFTLDSFDN